MIVAKTVDRTSRRHTARSPDAPRIRESRIDSHVHTNRRGNPNIQRKTYHVPSLGRRITLIVSAKDIKTIDRDGIDAVVARLRARGVKL